MTDKKITMGDIQEYMFKSLVRIDNGNIVNGSLVGIEIEGDRIMTFLIAPKAEIQDKKEISVLVPYKEGEDTSIKICKFGTDSLKWLYQDNLPIAALPFSPFINFLQEKQYKFSNIIITKKALISDEFKDSLKLIESIHAIAYPNGIHNERNFWPISYTTYTASPISQDFDGRPYFLVNGAPKYMSGAPVFVEISNFFKSCISFVGIWIEDIDIKKSAVGEEGNFSLILKAEKIFEFLEELKNKMQLQEMAQKESS